MRKADKLCPRPLNTKVAESISLHDVRQVAGKEKVTDEHSKCQGIHLKAVCAGSQLI